MTDGGTASTARELRRAGRFRVAAAIVGRGVLGAAILFAAAEVATTAGLVPPIYLPPATTIVAAGAALLTEPGFLLDIGSTLLAWALGLLLATVISIPLGLVLGASETGYRMASPLIEFMRPVPSVAWIPFAVLVFGQGLTMKVVLVAYATAWPILYNTVYGMHDVDPLAIEIARAFGLPRRAVLRRAVLPSAAPFIFTGIRVSASLGLIVVVGAELFAAAASGIGAFILNASNGGTHMDQVFASAAIAGLLGVGINLLFDAIDRRAFGWRLQRG
jgi:NitT/TauT family transport system permease protein